jgi:hypothetical protein
MRSGTMIRVVGPGGSNPLAPTIPITSCAGSNPALSSAWPNSQAFSFGAAYQLT